MMHQYSSTGLCVRSSPLKTGTTQSPRISISRAQPAFRGSSRSHSRGPPRFVSITNAATAATSDALFDLRPKHGVSLPSLTFSREQTCSRWPRDRSSHVSCTSGTTFGPGYAEAECKKHTRHFCNAICLSAPAIFPPCLLALSRLTFAPMQHAPCNAHVFARGPKWIASWLGRGRHERDRAAFAFRTIRRMIAPVLFAQPRCSGSVAPRRAPPKRPQWIWSPDHAKEGVPTGEACHFRKTMNLRAPEGGQVVDRGRRSVRTVSSTAAGSARAKRRRSSTNTMSRRFLMRGANVIAIRVQNTTGKTAALVARVTIKDGGEWISLFDRRKLANGTAAAAAVEHGALQRPRLDAGSVVRRARRDRSLGPPRECAGRAGLAQRAVHDRSAVRSAAGPGRAISSAR